MARIEDLATQDEIANSLLGPEAEQQETEQPVSEYSLHGEDLLNEFISEQEGNVFRDGDEQAAAIRELLRSERGEAERPEAGEQEREPRQAENQEAEAWTEPTPQEVQEGIAALDATIEQHGLNDPASAREFATDFCAAFGTDVYKAGVDVQGLGSTMAKVALSAANFYEQTKGDPSQIPPIPEGSARAFTHDILKSLGFDPRAVPVNEQMLANTAFRWALNFFDTYARHGGKVTDMSKLNDPQMAQMFLSSWLQAFGIQRQVGREEALKFADACGKYLLGFLGRRGAAQDRIAAAQNQGRRSSGRGRGQRVPASMREGIKGSKVQTFSTNQDIFSGQVMQDLAARRL